MSALHETHLQDDGQRSSSKRRRLVLVVLAAAAIFIVALFYPRPIPEHRPGIEWSPVTVGRYALVLPTRDPARTVMDAPLKLPVLSPDAAEELVAIEADLVGEPGASFELILEEEVGREVWRSAIPDEFVIEGRLLLRLSPREFDRGDYFFRVVDTGGMGMSTDIIESGFRIR